MNQQLIDIQGYLSAKGIEYKERHGELITNCVFSDCDKDSRGNEAHLYISKEGLYQCKKCGAEGNQRTLMKHFGDWPPPRSAKSTAVKPVSAKVKTEVIDRHHSALPDKVRTYLHDRGITDEQISDAKLGYGKFYGHHWITIPVKDSAGNWSFLKLRQDPSDSTNADKYKFSPIGSSAAIYNIEALKGNNDFVVICEGEFDCLVLQTQGIPAITSTAGAGTFKDEWISHLKNLQRVYIAFDNDDAGHKGLERLASKLAERLPSLGIYKIVFPNRMTDGKDITDYFTKYDGNPDELMYELPQLVAGPEPIDADKFEPMTPSGLANVLGLTIKRDEQNKVVTFLCQLTAYTENSQFNISFNAPSSTGKSYIPTEIARLFPQSDVKEIAYCSPTAFFHDTSVWDEEREVMIVDLSRKILIFLDQPHTLLLQHLRPLLSHDQKEINLKITDKTQKYGLKTKTVLLKGYPSVIFCTAGLQLDEQEATRFLLLSPEVHQVKIREGISATIYKEADQDKFYQWLEGDPQRKSLRDRIRAIKQEHIKEIKLSNYDQIEERFLAKRPMLKPRHQRDIKRLIALIKACALLNLWWRERDGSTITANQDDINEAFEIWDKISVSQELNIPPYLYNLYLEVIVAAWVAKNNGQVLDPAISVGLTRQEIQAKHMEVHGRPLNTITFRQEMLPMLETVGLITQEEDPMDKRRRLIYPTSLAGLPKNSEDGGGVDFEYSEPEGVVIE